MLCSCLLGLDSGMAAECAGRSKLSELMPYHVLGDIDGDEFIPVMHGECMSDKFRRDRAIARPRFYHLFLTGFVQDFDFLEKLLVDVRSFF